MRGHSIFSVFRLSSSVIEAYPNNLYSAQLITLERLVNLFF